MFKKVFPAVVAFVILLIIVLVFANGWVKEPSATATAIVPEMRAPEPDVELLAPEPTPITPVGVTPTAIVLTTEQVELLKDIGWYVDGGQDLESLMGGILGYKDEACDLGLLFGLGKVEQDARDGSVEAYFDSSLGSPQQMEEIQAVADRARSAVALLIVGRSVFCSVPGVISDIMEATPES